METRSKAQRDAEVADVKGSGFITGQGEIHPTCDPSPPKECWSRPVFYETYDVTRESGGSDKNVR